MKNGSKDPMILEGAAYGIWCLLLSLSAPEIAVIHNWMIKIHPSTLLAFIASNPDLRYLTTYVPMILFPAPLMAAIFSIHILRRMPSSNFHESDHSISSSLGYALVASATAFFMIYFSIYGLDSIASVGFRNQTIWEVVASSRATVGIFYFVTYWGAAMFVSLSIFYLARARYANH